jgi:hypothetical protein
MQWHPRNFGGKRPDPESIKREGWNADGILVVKADDERLSWPEQEQVKQIGEKLYGKRDKDGQA